MAKLDESNHYWAPGRKYRPQGGAGSVSIPGKRSMPEIGSLATQPRFPFRENRKTCKQTPQGYTAKIMRFQSRAYFFSFCGH